MSKPLSVDTKCYELAEAFLEDMPQFNTTANTERLAQAIQDVIEDELGDIELHAGLAEKPE